MKMNLMDLSIPELNMDRRQRKTRMAIENALLDLMQTKPLETISISELADHADINRKTFYNHYTCIEDVVEDINKKISMIIFEALPEKITINNEIEIYHLLFDLTTQIEPHKAILKQVARTSDNFSFIDYFKDLIFPYIERNLMSYHINPAITPFINNYLFNGISSIYYEWFENDVLNAQQVALLCYNLTISAIRLDNYKDIMK
ncbi:MAG: TetR/AcrR family transcriptional regulator [Eubacteriales bacterium]|nr:TetR/AcrR family transcriptional regulator [Eubacteriales bacterium]